MNKLVLGTGVVLAAVGSAGWMQHEDNAALRREVALLRAELQMTMRGAERSRAQEGPTPAASGVAGGVAVGTSEELVKLREEIAALRRSTQSLNRFAEMAQAAQAAKALEKSTDAVTTKLVPATQWRNVGKATPEAATETALWAAVGGDVDTLKDMLTFTGSARVKADAWFATLSDATRQQYGSPEKVMALLIARDAASLTGMQVLGKKEVTANDVGVRIRFAADEKTKDDTFVMHRGADGWRMLLADQTVDNFAKKLAGKR